MALVKIITQLRNIKLSISFSWFRCPYLIGVSQKSLIADITIDGYNRFGINKKIIEPSNRLSGSIVFAIHGYNNGIQIIRTHDVFETKQAILVSGNLCY